MNKQDLTLEEQLSEALFGWGKTDGNREIVQGLATLVVGGQFDALVGYLEHLSKEYVNVAFETTDALKSQAYIGSSRGCLYLIDRLHTLKAAIRDFHRGGD